MLQRGKVKSKKTSFPSQRKIFIPALRHWIHKSTRSHFEKNRFTSARLFILEAQVEVFHVSGFDSWSMRPLRPARPPKHKGSSWPQRHPSRNTMSCDKPKPSQWRTSYFQNSTLILWCRIQALYLEHLSFQLRDSGVFIHAFWTRSAIQAHVFSKRKARTARELQFFS